MKCQLAKINTTRRTGIPYNLDLKIIYKFFYLCVVLFLFSQCKKEPAKVAHSNIYSHISPDNDECLYVYPLLNGSILLVSTNNDTSSGRLLLSKYSESGDREWVKVISRKAYGRRINPLKDGSLLISIDAGENRLIKINDAGNVVFDKPIHDSIHDGYGYTIQGEDHHFYNMFHKPAAWLSNANKILEYDENGNLLKGETLTTIDNVFGGLMQTQYIYKVNGNKTVYFCGLIYLNPVNMLLNSHLFVGRLEFQNKKLVSTNRKIVILDPANENDINDANNLCFLNTPDNKLVIMNPQQQLGRNFKTHITQVDENLDKTWELDISLGNGNTIARSLRICPDGNYLIAGSCRVSGKGLEQPFVAKISSDGKLIWSKIFDMVNNAALISGFQKTDGSVIMGGNTTSFGAGLNLNDLFILKTDKDGNLK